MARARVIFHRRLPIPAVFPPFQVEGYIEFGAYEIEGYGYADIYFQTPFQTTPSIVKESLGYVEVWRFKVPAPLFVTSVDRRKIRVLNVGTNKFMFIAVGR